MHSGWAEVITTALHHLVLVLVHHPLRTNKQPNLSKPTSNPPPIPPSPPTHPPTHPSAHPNPSARPRSVVEQYMGKKFQAFKPLPEWKFEDYLGWHEQVRAGLRV